MRMVDLRGLMLLVLKDVGCVLDGVDSFRLEKLLGEIKSARRVYIAGSGRSLLIAKTFAQRLYQCGIAAYALGDTNIPPAGAGDLMIACSSSGATSAALAAASAAKGAGCSLAAVTACPESALAKASDFVLDVPIRSCPESLQPLGSLFEQSVLIIFDCAAVALMEMLGLRAEDLAGRHSNLQ
jgi:6-phospho-3-hexuloisomerase